MKLTSDVKKKTTKNNREHKKKKNNNDKYREGKTLKKESFTSFNTKVIRLF